MTCFMKKMRYMEKNMRDGHAWSGSEVTAHKNVKQLNKLNCQVPVAEKSAVNFP